MAVPIKNWNVLSRRGFLKAAAAPAFLGALAKPLLANDSGDQRTVTKVHLIFKTHLDIGFTDLGANVVLGGSLPGGLGPGGHGVERRHEPRHAPRSA